MNQIIKYFLLFILLFPVIGQGQFNRAYLSMNYRNNLESHFSNLKFELGSKKNSNFISISTGVNFSTFVSSVAYPYDWSTLQMNYTKEFQTYESRKKGYQFSIGYAHYFTNSEKRRIFFPYLEIEAFYFQILDSYNVTLKNIYTEIKTNLPFKYKINTLSCETGFGLQFEHKNLIAKIGLSVNYFFPLIDENYDPINGVLVDGLPFKGTSYSGQLGIGFKLF